jgi:hypothetical protein
MKRQSISNTGRIAGELAGLPDLDREALIEKWHALYGIEPPDGLRNKFLIHAIAYRLQEKTLGGLKPSTIRFLEKASDENGSAKPILPMTCIKPGTRLLREWHGVTHEVVILEDGVQWSGKHYRSLSEVARAITGARWSGPLFFGLKKQEVA